MANVRAVMPFYADVLKSILFLVLTNYSSTIQHAFKQLTKSVIIVEMFATTNKKTCTNLIPQ